MARVIDRGTQDFCDDLYTTKLPAGRSAPIQPLGVASGPYSCSFSVLRLRPVRFCFSAPTISVGSFDGATSATFPPAYHLNRLRAPRSQERSGRGYETLLIREHRQHHHHTRPEPFLMNLKRISFAFSLGAFTVCSAPSSPQHRRNCTPRSLIIGHTVPQPHPPLRRTAIPDIRMSDALLYD